MNRVVLLGVLALSLLGSGCHKTMEGATCSPEGCPLSSRNDSHATDSFTLAKEDYAAAEVPSREKLINKIWIQSSRIHCVINAEDPSAVECLPESKNLLHAITFSVGNNVSRSDQSLYAQVGVKLFKESPSICSSDTVYCANVEPGTPSLLDDQRFLVAETLTSINFSHWQFINAQGQNSNENVLSLAVGSAVHYNCRMPKYSSSLICEITTTYNGHSLPLEGYVEFWPRLL